MFTFKYSLVLALTSLYFLGHSQTFKENHDFGLALSQTNAETNISLSWKQLYPVTKNQKLKIGYGARFNSYFSSNQDYITAPAELTSGEKGPQVFFIENINENLDTIRVFKTQHNSLNAVIYIEYKITDKIGIGFNIDAVGFSFGPESDGHLISSNSPNSGTEIVVSKPTPYNVLLVSDNDIGMLNSELFVNYDFTNRLSVNLGFTFLFTEYTTDAPISYNFDNDRFRRKSLLGMIGINYKPFRK